MFRTCLALAALASPALGQTAVTFENPTLAQPLPGPNSFQNGATLSPPGSFTTGGATFNNDYNPTFGSWTGWSYSNVADVTTPGFGNQYAAYSLPTGGGDASANYGVAFGAPTIDFAPGNRPVSARITNTTYAALSMRDGDQFAKKFGGTSGDDADFFVLTIRGSNAAGVSTGAVDFALADFRFADNARDYIVSQWTTVDLTALAADTSRLSFEFTSSDVGAFGINTPTYFAADNFAVVPVPEPFGAVLAAAAGLVAWRVRRTAGAAAARAC